MDEETKNQGVESAGAANQQEQGVSAAVDGQQGATGAADQSQEEKGQLAALTAEREKRQAAEAERDQLQSQLLLQANQPQPTQAQTQKQQNLVAQVIDSLGLSNEEFLSAGQMADVLNTVIQIQNTANAQQSFIASHPDYAEVVGKNFMGQFQIAPPLQRAIQKNPVLGQALMSNPQAGIIAYEIASKDPQYLQELADKNKPPEQTAAEKAAEAITQANKQVSIGTVSGGGQVDQASVYASATDAEIAASVEKAKAKV